MNSSTSSPIPSRITTLLVYGRAPLALAGLICAILTMILRNPSLYFLGMACLVIAMVFDLVDGLIENLGESAGLVVTTSRARFAKQGERARSPSFGERADRMCAHQHARRVEE